MLRGPRFLLLLTLIIPARAHAIGANWPISDTPRFWILGEGLGHFSLDGSYFQSSANYDVGGLEATPSTEDRTQYASLRVHGGYGFAPRLSLFAQGDFRMVSQQNTNAAAANAPGTGNHGPGDAFVGFRWLVWRSSPTDRVYPTEWSPESVVTLIEGTWNFPLYDRAGAGNPPLGDQSNDFSGIARVAWYANEWLAFSAGSGYIYRTAGYLSLIPWNLRVDMSAQERHRMRFWLDFQSFENFDKSGVVLNPQQPDPLPNGSLLFKSYAPKIRTGTLGAGYLLSREWELVADASVTASGVDAAKGWGAGLGITWRPYQVPEIKYDEYRQIQIERLQHERREYKRRDVVKYGFRATIVKVSAHGNYVKIFFGERDRVRQGDTFYIMPPPKQGEVARRPVAFATAVQVTPDAAFLHVDERYFNDVNITEGFETRRVYFENEEQ